LETTYAALADFALITLWPERAYRTNWADGSNRPIRTLRSNWSSATLGPFGSLETANSPVEYHDTAIAVVVVLATAMLAFLVVATAIICAAIRVG
jgi:hypothetical protein